MKELESVDGGYPDINLGPGESVQSIIAKDTHPAASPFRTTSWVDMGNEDLSIDRYTSREWHEREKETVWKKTWQVACRLEDIPEVGSYIVYDICDDSVIIVRTGADTVKAYVNACLHRGNALCLDQGRKNEFRCPYHGFTWSLQGQLKYVPGAWDFDHLNREQFCLPEVRLDTWGGFVFVNLDDNCAPLRQYLELLPQHLPSEELEKRYKAAHVSQVVHCNWKIALEAFIEGFHVPETHYEKDERHRIDPNGIAAFSHDTKVQYDVWADSRHINRLILVDGVPSQYVANKVDEQQVVDAMLRRLPEEMRPRVEEGQRARDVLGDFNRKALTQRYGVDLNEASTFDVMDQVQYNIFPNFTVWPTPFAPLCYRFRPWNDSPDESLFEIWMLHPVPTDGRDYQVMAERRIGKNDLWADQEEMGVYGPVIDQDIPNLSRMTKGLKATRKKGVTLARYQESRIRQYLKTLEEYVNGG